MTKPAETAVFTSTVGCDVAGNGNPDLVLATPLIFCETVTDSSAGSTGALPVIALPYPRCLPQCTLAEHQRVSRCASACPSGWYCCASLGMTCVQNGDVCPSCPDCASATDTSSGNSFQFPGPAGDISCFTHNPPSAPVPPMAPPPPTSLVYDCAALPNVDQLGGKLDLKCLANCDVWASFSSDYDAVVANNFLIGEPIVFAADSAKLADDCWTNGNTAGNNEIEFGWAGSGGWATHTISALSAAAPLFVIDSFHLLGGGSYYELRNGNTDGLGSNPACHYSVTTPRLCRAGPDAVVQLGEEKGLPCSLVGPTQNAQGTGTCAETGTYNTFDDAATALAANRNSGDASCHTITMVSNAARTSVNFQLFASTTTTPIAPGDDPRTSYTLTCPPPPSTPPPAPPPFSPPPPYQAWALPVDLCGWAGGGNVNRYIYNTRTEANQACLDQGCSGLADPNMVTSELFDWQSTDTEDVVWGQASGGGGRCMALWWASDPPGVAAGRPG